MMKLLPRLIAAIALTTMPASGRADYVLSLSTSADVNHLQLGQSVTFDVSLSGIDSSNSGTYLSYLEATVSYDSSLLGSPSAVNPGAIVPDSNVFFGTPLSNAADAFYDYSANTPPSPLSPPISSSGVFFSFQVTATAVGSGTLSFSADAATLASDPIQTDQFNPRPIDLSFTIEAGGSGTAVPEPPTFVSLISSFLGGLIFLGMRNLVRRARHSKMLSQGSLG